MNDEQLEKYLKQIRFLKPAPELRQQILSKSFKYWLPERRIEEHSQALVTSSAFSLMFTHRFKRGFTVAAAVVILIASFSYYNNEVDRQRDTMTRISSAVLLGDMIDERLETMTFPGERRFGESEESKIILESIKKKFSPQGFMDK